MKLAAENRGHSARQYTPQQGIREDLKCHVTLSSVAIGKQDVSFEAHSVQDVSFEAHSVQDLEVFSGVIGLLWDIRVGATRNKALDGVVAESYPKDAGSRLCMGWSGTG